MDDLELNTETLPTSEQDEPHLTRAERRDQQVQRILEAAKACFVRSGFQGASMQQICAEAGMSPGALYRYFASKEAVIEAICAADRAEDAKLFSRILENPSVVDGVVEGAMAHMRHVHETHAAPLFAEIMAESMRNPVVGVTCLENIQEVQELFRGYLGRAIERGEIDPVVDLDTLLPSLTSIAHGMAVNDLPSQRIPFEKLEIVIRATVVALLRPTRKPAANRPSERAS
jgi:TetR/AcrR family transcriptional repressor of uid operon